MSRREKLLAYWEWVGLPSMVRYWVSDPLHKLAWWLVNLQAIVSPEGGREDGPISWWSIYAEGEESGSNYSMRFHHRSRRLPENDVYNRTYLALTEAEHTAYHSASKILDTASSEARDALQSGDLDAAASAIERARTRLAVEAEPGWQEPTARCFAAGAAIDEAYANANPDRVFAS